MGFIQKSFFQVYTVVAYTKKNPSSMGSVHLHFFLQSADLNLLCDLEPSDNLCQQLTHN